jgi:hypothetical protein
LCSVLKRGLLHYLDNPLGYTIRKHLDAKRQLFLSLSRHLQNNQWGGFIFGPGSYANLEVHGPYFQLLAPAGEHAIPLPRLYR